MLGDRAYDSAELRQWLSQRGTKSVVPKKSNRKQPFSFDRKSYKQRHRIENAFCRVKDFRRGAGCTISPLILVASDCFSMNRMNCCFNAACGRK